MVAICCNTGGSGSGGLVVVVPKGIAPALCILQQHVLTIAIVNWMSHCEGSRVL